MFWASGPWQMESNRSYPPVHVYLSISLRTPSPSGFPPALSLPLLDGQASIFPPIVFGQFQSCTSAQTSPTPDLTPVQHPTLCGFHIGRDNSVAPQRLLVFFFFQNRRTKKTTTGRAFGACLFCIYSYLLVSMFLSFFFHTYSDVPCLFSFFSRLETPESTFRVSRNVPVDRTRCCSGSDLVSINPR